MLLQKLFKDPESWTCLDADTQRELYAMLPAISAQNGEINTAISPTRQEPYAQHIKAFLAHVEEHLELGAGRQAWKDEAVVATRARAQGKYDALITEQQIQDEAAYLKTKMQARAGKDRDKGHDDTDDQMEQAGS